MLLKRRRVFFLRSLAHLRLALEVELNFGSALLSHLWRGVCRSGRTSVGLDSLLGDLHLFQLLG